MYVVGLRSSLVGYFPFRKEYFGIILIAVFQQIYFKIVRKLNRGKIKKLEIKVRKG